MSPGFGESKDPAEGLSFVDELKRDISSYLLQSPEDDVEQTGILDFIPGTLCYSSPHDFSEDRWREARTAWGTDEANSANPDASNRHRIAQRIFGAPPSAAEIRWPPRPQDQQNLKSLRRTLLRGRGSPDRGDGSDSNISDSEGSCDSETGPRRHRWHRSYLASRDRSGSGRGGEWRSLGTTASSGDLGQRYREDRQKCRRREHSERTMRQSMCGHRNRSLSDVWTGRACASPDGCMNGRSSSSSGNVSPDGRISPQVNVNDLLEFTSCFESGNLQYSVYNAEDDSYTLILDNDIHTRGHTQWFYFAVRNGRLGQTAHFRIVNMSKAKSLFRLGMKPLVWSEADVAQKRGFLRAGSASSNVFPFDAEPASNLWRACTGNVEYHRSRSGSTMFGSLHTLAFEYTFEWPGDCVFFAYCVPFTYSMLRTSLSAMSSDPVLSKRCRFRTLTNTTGNVKCDLVEISNFSISRKLKKAVVVSSRVHPGESNASWLVNGLMKFLLSDTAEAHVLRDHFVWQIVPMLNPDGVVCGNYRCGLTGVDLNRQWRRPHKELHCTVYKLKKLIQAAKRKARLCMYLDLHGHSRKCGVFSYACGEYPKDDYRRFTVRMFPKLLSMLTPEFEFPSCRWRVGKGKRGTGRVVVSKDLGLTETYTIETSFFGAVVKDQPEAALQNRASPPPLEGADVVEAGGSDSEGSDQDRAGPGCGAASPEVDAQVIPPTRIILFTPAKLEEIGSTFARALLLQQNLGAAVQLAEKRLARQKACAVRATDQQDQLQSRNGLAQTQNSSLHSVREGLAYGRETPCASGTATPSGASDASESEEEELLDVIEVPEQLVNDSFVAADTMQVTAIRDPLDSGCTPEEAAALARPYLDIDVTEVLQEFEDGLNYYSEVDSPGSDSDPSEDNLNQQELGQLVRILSRKRKSSRHGTSGPSGGTAIASLTTNGNQARAMQSVLSRAKAEVGTASTRTGWRKLRPSDRQIAACRRDRRTNVSGHSQRSEALVVSKTTAVQRTVAFGQTTYVVPPRFTQNFANSGRSLSTGSPATDSQAFTLYADIGVEKAGGLMSPERDRVRRFQGWGQQQWPAITATPGRQCPSQKEATQVGAQLATSANSEAFVLLGTPPKDRFAFPQGGVGDARRLHCAPSSSRSLCMGRSTEEVGALSRPRVCARNASNTMLQWQRTHATAPTAASQTSSATTSFTGSSLTAPTQSQSVLVMADRPNLRLNGGSKQKLASRPGTASARSPVNGSPEDSDTLPSNAELQCVEMKIVEDFAPDERPNSAICLSKPSSSQTGTPEKVAAQCQLFSPTGLGNGCLTGKVFRQDFTLRHKKS